MLISDIKPYERNARHNDKAIPKVAESIRKFGLRGSIVLESRDNPVIVCGHTRVAAAKSLGWTEIPDDHIEYCDGLTQDEIDAFRLIDNKTGEIATWNVALLKSEAKRIEGYIERAPKWGGGVTYRGMSLPSSVVKGLTVGGTFDVNAGTASWSTQESTARSFSKSGSGGRHVVFVSQTQSKGTSIKHISYFTKENEVLVSKNARYTITNISTKSGSPYTYVYVKEN